MIDVWLVDLEKAVVPPPTQGESARAARFATLDLQRRYLKAHGALRAILGNLTNARLEFARLEKGKPFLPLAPEVRFNLSRSCERALIAVSREVEVGVDIERIRPIPNYAAVAERFFPPDEDPPADEADFFRRWTRIEARLKACGAGLYGVGRPIEGDWTIREIDVGPDYAGAVTERIHEDCRAGWLLFESGRSVLGWVGGVGRGEGV
jgi:4'-phosphopantetheinyl transferase